MNIRIFRKAIGLLFVDIVIIIGIFILQFRTDSSIIEKIGNLQITLERNDAQESELTLKNKFVASYNGLTFYCDDKNPVQIIDAQTNERRDVQLVDWQKTTDLSCTFLFTEGVSFTVSLASENSNATLNTSINLPSSVSELFIPYNYAYNMKIQKQESNNIILSDKKSSWEISALNLDNGYMNLNHRNFTASYSVFDATQKFSFDSITSIALAEKSVFDQTVSNFKNNLISSFKSNNTDANLTEQSVVSYVAAMAENGNYTDAIDSISQNFKKSDTRTYLSAPYFNTLDKMNDKLSAAVKESNQNIAKFAESGSLDFFNSRNIASHLCVCDNKSNVLAVLENAAAADVETLTIAQTTGIIQAFVELSALNSEYAKVLLPIIPDCVEHITQSCSYDGNILTISENDTFLSVVQAVETGYAILRYGTITGNETLVKAGRVLINSYLAESSSFDLRTLSNLYPVVAYDNTYYPHYEQLQTNDGKFVWAWTCAKSIFYEKDEAENSITLNIDFPEGYTHYVILKGIPQFTTIYIYNMAFRTDPRFETYNSSGYVFKSEQNTLLLKSRHKSRIETVKLDYAAPVVRTPKPAEPAPAAESSTESENTTEESSTNSTGSVADNFVPVIPEGWEEYY